MNICIRNMTCSAVRQPCCFLCSMDGFVWCVWLVTEH